MTFADRHGPTPDGEAGRRAARAAVAAGRRGRFWDMRAAHHHHGRGFSEAELRASAGELGLGSAHFGRDLAVPETVARVEEDRSAAEAAGVEHTAALFEGGVPHLGLQDRTSIREAVRRPPEPAPARRARFFA